jgi:hypothetical protein
VRRTPLLLILFAATAAWAGAQHGLDMAVRQTQLAQNRTTLALLVDSGLAMGDPTADAAARAEWSRKAADAVRHDLADATARQDVDRVVELGEHLTKLFADGLVPTLSAATPPEGSPASEQLKTTRRQAVADANSAAGLDFAAGILGGSNRVKDVTKKLHDAAEHVKAAAEGK